jgi:hypothetical protein
VTTYPQPATPLPWREPRDGIIRGANVALVCACTENSDSAYIVRAANAFPHLVAALGLARDEIDAQRPDCDNDECDRELCSWCDAIARIDHALAIARGEVTP